MSEFTISCPNCGAQLSASDEYIGRKAACPECGTCFVITSQTNQDVVSNSTPPISDDAVMEGDSLSTEFDDTIVRRRPFATIALMAASIFATIILFCKTGSIEPDAQSCVAYGANFKALTMGGQWWRMISSAFLHFDIKHLVMNMLCLYSIGCLLERLAGHAKIVELYLLTAITGALASCIVHPDLVCAGASGAVFGLFGAQVAYVMILREKLGLTSDALGGYMKSGLVFIAINFAYSLMPGVDMAAHVGGLIGGLAIGAVIALSVKEGNGRYVVASQIVSGISFVVALVLAVSLVTGKNAGRLSIAGLTAKVSQMLAENLNKENNGKDDGVFEVTHLSLIHDKNNKYLGDVKLTIKCGGKVYPLNSRIEVKHDAMETSYVLDEDDFKEIEKALESIDVENLKIEVSQMLSENISKGLKKEGYKSVSVNVKKLSLEHGGGDRYHGNVELVCRYDGETETFKSQIKVTYDGKTIAYELKTDE